MPVNQALIKKLRKKSYPGSVVNLENQGLEDADISELIQLLPENPTVIELNLKNNKLSYDSLKLLSKNTTLKTLRLKPGNPEMTVAQFDVFLGNQTITALPFCGGGPKQVALRAHIKKNATAPAPAKIPEAKKLDKETPKEEPFEEHAAVETGQESYLQFSLNLLLDLKQFNAPKQYVICYMATALNLYMHNASHRPLPHYGKAQELEISHKLFYSRSQTKHPARTLHDKYAKNKKDTRKTSLFPLNPALLKELQQYILPDDPNKDQKETRLSKKRKKLINTLKAINPDRGFPKNGAKIPNYFTLFLAHSGVRQNNIKGLTLALEGVAKSDNNTDALAALKEKLEKQLPKKVTKNIKALDRPTVIRRIKAIQGRFSELQKKLSTLSTQPQDGLQKAIIEQRKSHNNVICETARKRFAKIDKSEQKLLTVEPNGHSCISIKIDPEKFKFHLKGATHSENATNVILGFFCGLLNDHARRKGLSIHVDRRQSFGFLRPTLTDAGKLCLRLSLGLEPAEFNQVVLDSLNDLYSVLNSSIIFPEAFKGMKSEDKQWQSGFEAQYYLQKSKEPKSQKRAEQAFNQYLSEFVVADTKEVSKPETFFELPKVKKSKPEKKFDKTCLFPLLQKTLNYATNFAASLESLDEDGEFIQLKHSYWHALLKLYQHCNDASSFLENLDSQEVTAAYAAANQYLENILEYLITLDSLEQIRLEMQGKSCNRTELLYATEKKHAVSSLNLSDTQVNVYITSNGQQAIITSLIAMDLEMFTTTKKHKKRGQNNVYNFNESYFELDLFLEDVGGLKTQNKSTASIVFIDAIQLNELKFPELTALKVIIIDTTREPGLYDQKLKEVIAEAHQQNIWVVLTSSCLKHNELGLDKYTAGEIITLAPNPNDSLLDGVKDIFTSVSEAGVHPTLASYLQMVNEICGDKPLPNTKQLTKAASAGLRRFGLTKQDETTPEAIAKKQIEPVLTQQI